MENNDLPFKQTVLYRYSLSYLFAFLICVLTGCSTLKNVRQRWFPPKVKEPQPIRHVEGFASAAESEPVWVNPVLNKVWIEPQTDRHGNFVGGHYVATIVEPGRWSTQEEAELSEKAFLRTEYTEPILPEPTSSHLSKHLKSLPVASMISLQNQLPRPSESSAKELPKPIAHYFEQTCELEITNIPPGEGHYSIDSPKGLIKLHCWKSKGHIEFQNKTYPFEYKGKDTTVRLKLD